MSPAEPALSCGESSHAIWFSDHGEIGDFRKAPRTAMAFNPPIEIRVIALALKAKR